MTIELAITRRQGEFTLDVAIKLEGPVSALFGPSGAGKTSILQIVAGLLRPDSGRIVVDGKVWFDSSAGIDMPAHRRRVGYVFQEGRLFPHFSVRRNLMYGRWFRRDETQRIRPDEVIELLGIGHLLERRPVNLSGGEAQRIAIGRALISDPDLLLMDEPLASLDAARRAEILPYIEQLRDRFHLPTIYVSHTREEIDRLANEVVTMEAGRVMDVCRKRI